jgi:hypothetical protein
VQVFRQHSSTLRYVLGVIRAGSGYLNRSFASIKHGLLPISRSSLVSSLQAAAWPGSAFAGLDDALSGRGKLKGRPFETKATVGGVESGGHAAAVCGGEHKAGGTQSSLSRASASNAADRGRVAASTVARGKVRPARLRIHSDRWSDRCRVFHRI